MKSLRFLILPALWIPCASFAQEQAQPVQPVEQIAPAANAGTAQNDQNPAESAQPQPPRRRMMRTIENREFNNKDKILLLLSAHCDFPTKEDLISTVNTQMLVSDRNQAAKNEENTGDSAALKISKAAVSAVGKAGVSQNDVENYLQDTLFEILSDESQLFSVRRRALEALAYFDTPKNLQMLDYIVTHPEQIKRPLMLVQAIRSYPQVAPDKAPEALERYLDSPNDMIRFVTISTLKNTPGQGALRVLQERRNIEKNTFFKSRLDEAIANHCKKDVFCGTGQGF